MLILIIVKDAFETDRTNAEQYVSLDIGATFLNGTDAIEVTHNGCSLNIEYLYEALR